MSTATISQTATTEISKQTADSIVAALLKNMSLPTIDAILSHMTDEEYEAIGPAVVRYCNR